MDKKCNRVKLYASLNNSVLKKIKDEGVIFSKREYVEKKYEESSKIFTTAYSCFVREADKIVRRPENAEYPYWVFTDASNLERYNDSSIIELEVPLDEVIFFNMYDWNKILSLEFIGENEEEEKEFKEVLKKYGIKHDSDIMLTSFYPQLKSKVTDSWNRVFLNHEKIKNGDYSCVPVVQAALWQIKKEWIRGEES